MQTRHRQRGVTAIGMLILVCVFGVIGMAVLKITPLYLQHLRLATIMDDVHDELGGTGTTKGCAYRPTRSRSRSRETATS